MSNTASVQRSAESQKRSDLIVAMTVGTVLIVGMGVMTWSILSDFIIGMQALRRCAEPTSQCSAEMLSQVYDDIQAVHLLVITVPIAICGALLLQYGWRGFRAP